MSCSVKLKRNSLEQFLNTFKNCVTDAFIVIVSISPHALSWMKQSYVSLSSFKTVLLWPCTCIRLLIVLVFCPGFLSLLVVLAAALIQPRVNAGAAVAQLAFPAADDRVLRVDLLRTLEPFFPSALGVLPAVAILPAGFYVDNDQEKGHDHGDIRRESSSVHPRPGGRTLAHWWRIKGFNSSRQADLVSGVIRWVIAIWGVEGMKWRRSGPLRSCHVFAEIPCVIQFQRLQMTPQKLLSKSYTNHTSNKFVPEKTLILQVYSSLQNWIISSSDTVTKEFMFPFASLNGIAQTRNPPQYSDLGCCHFTDPSLAEACAEKTFQTLRAPLAFFSVKAGGGQVWVRWTDPKRAVYVRMRGAC